MLLKMCLQFWISELIFFSVSELWEVSVKRWESDRCGRNLLLSVSLILQRNYSFYYSNKFTALSSHSKTKFLILVGKRRRKVCVTICCFKAAEFMTYLYFLPFDGNSLIFWTKSFPSRQIDAVCDFYSLHSFFKKRQQEKKLHRPRRDGDDESVEDVEDDEFEKILGESRRSVQWEQGQASRGRHKLPTMH